MNFKKLAVFTAGVAMSLSCVSAQEMTSFTNGLRVFTKSAGEGNYLQISKSADTLGGISVDCIGYHDYTSLNIHEKGMRCYGIKNSIIFDNNSLTGNIGIGCEASDIYKISLLGNTRIKGMTYVEGSFSVDFPEYHHNLRFNSDSCQMFITTEGYKALPFDITFQAAKVKFENPVFIQNTLNVTGKITCNDEIEVSKLTASNLKAKDVNIEINNAADYVFEEDYNLQSLSEVEDYVKANKHLPGVPSAQEMAENGVSVSEMSNLLLEKIEELTLHMIQLEKENAALKAKVESLEK